MYIDNVKFAKTGQELSGTLNLANLERVQELDNYSGVIEYKLLGSLDTLNRPTLTLSVCGIITALCQNCLQPMEIQIENSSRITVFFNEDQLDSALFTEQDSGVEDGVLAEEEFDVLNLVEDEVIMLLPYASKHDECMGLSYHDEAESPFSVLKQII